MLIPLFSMSLRRFGTSDTTSESQRDSGAHDDQADYIAEIADIEAEYIHRRQRRQALVGTVISSKADKSITVRVMRPKYVKKYEQTIYEKRMFMAHDEDEECGEGDLVRIVPCPPVSRRKRHKLIDIIKRAQRLES